MEAIVEARCDGLRPLAVRLLELSRAGALRGSSFAEAASAQYKAPHARREVEHGDDGGAVGEEHACLHSEEHGEAESYPSDSSSRFGNGGSPRRRRRPAWTTRTRAVPRPIAQRPTTKARVTSGTAPRRRRRLGPLRRRGRSPWQSLAWRDHDAIDPRTPGVRRVRGRRPTRPAGRPHPCVARTKVQVRPSHSQLSGRDMWLVVDVEKAPYWGNGSWSSGAERSPQPLSGGRA